MTELTRGRITPARNHPPLWRWDCNCGAHGVAGSGPGAQAKLNDHLLRHCIYSRDARDRGLKLGLLPIAPPIAEGT